MAVFNPLASLTDNLAAFDYTHVAVGNGMRDVVDARGVVVFTGRYEATWKWLQQKAVESAAAAAPISSY